MRLVRRARDTVVGFWRQFSRPARHLSLGFLTLGGFIAGSLLLGLAAIALGLALAWLVRERQLYRRWLLPGASLLLAAAGIAFALARAFDIELLS